MTLGRREKILALAAAAIAAAAVAFFLFSGSDRPLSELREERDAKRAKLDEKMQVVRRTAAAEAKLVQWQKRSLPSKTDVARSSYHHWLHSLVERLKIKSPQVPSLPDQDRKGAYTLLSYRVQGEATVEQLAQLLHEFYAAGHLHLIRRIDLSRPEGKRELQFFIAIEAISLPGADRADKLTAVRSNRLERPGAADYVKKFARRQMEADRYLEGHGVFAAYVPPSPPPVPRKDPPKKPDPPPKPSFDHAKYTVVAAIVDVGGISEVWLLTQTTGKQLKLAEGAEFTIGPLAGKVRKIGRHEVELELDGKRRVVPEGAALTEGRDGVL